jgi:hypothetical protein
MRDRETRKINETRENFEFFRVLRDLPLTSDSANQPIDWEFSARPAI